MEEALCSLNLEPCGGTPTASASVPRDCSSQRICYPTETGCQPLFMNDVKIRPCGLDP
jgi:hypothetical protein